MPDKTREQFENEYIEDSDIPRERFEAHFVTVECDCGADGCQGWRVDSKALLEKDV